MREIVVDRRNVSIVKSGDFKNFQIHNKYPTILLLKPYFNNICQQPRDFLINNAPTTKAVNTEFIFLTQFQAGGIADDMK